MRRPDYKSIAFDIMEAAYVGFLVGVMIVMAMTAIEAIEGIKELLTAPPE